MKKRTDYRWVVKIVFLSIAISMVFTLVSTKSLEGTGYIVAFSVLLLFILIGIGFDIIGVAVTSASAVPFHSMASHREKGAIEALKLIKNAEKVSSVCNDVVGDISGIISGTTSAVIVVELVGDLNGSNLFFSLVVSGLVAGMTIGGKAVGKALAINHSTEIVHSVGQFISAVNGVFHKK